MSSGLVKLVLLALLLTMLTFYSSAQTVLVLDEGLPFPKRPHKGDTIIITYYSVHFSPYRRGDRYEIAYVKQNLNKRVYAFMHGRRKLTIDVESRIVIYSHKNKIKCTYKLL